MSENNDYCLIEYISDINVSIKRPLQQTLRIKFSTFDVSANYLIFGATSGGVYIFNRRNYEFLKLVPTKEGAIVKLAICPEEKFIVVATSKGLIISLENCFNDSQIRYQIFNDHEGNIITSLIWHSNEIYCGDNKGKVSVILLATTLSKTIFHHPTATLMHVDSTITQLDAYKKFILVSTKTKTFLCDTDEEQYRQIGKKLRDGNFGACFLWESQQEHKTPIKDKEKSRFKVLKEDEHFTVSQTENAKIFCTRPGFRLWEANFEASVICTYQFKSSLSENQTECLCIDTTNHNAHLKTRKITSGPLFDNFGPLMVVLNKFLLTFSQNNLIIIDIQTTSNVLLIYEMRDIKEVRVYENYIYVWNKKDLRVIALMHLELIILKLLKNKQFVLCMEICTKFHDELIKLLENSEKLNSLMILKDKFGKNVHDAQMESIFNRISENKLKRSNINGIVKVENGHIDLEDVAGCSNKTNGESKKEQHPHLDQNYVNNILYKQFQVNQLYNKIDTTQLSDLLESKNSLEEIVELFEEFIKFVVKLDVDNNRVQEWCYEQYLKYVNKKHEGIFLKDIPVDSMALKYIFDGFKSINSNKDANSQCKHCAFPLPLSPENKEIQFFRLGKELYYKLNKEQRANLKTEVPFVWQVAIEEISDPLPLLISLSDAKLLQTFSANFTYDKWEDSLRLLMKLKQNICLNCEKVTDFDKSRTIGFKNFGLIMISRMGGMQTTSLLKKYAQFIPNEELGYEFYQTCLLSAVVSSSKSCSFVNSVIGGNSRLENEFECGLKQYLSHKYLGTNDGLAESALAEGKVENAVCSVCQLNVENPILGTTDKLNCGHVFHKICLHSNAGICSICSSN